MKLKIGDKVKIVRVNPNFYLKEKINKNNVYTIIGNETLQNETIKSFNLNDNSPFRWFENELELVKDNKKFFKTLPNNYTGNIEVENGYIVKKGILDEVEKEYLKTVIRPFKNKVKYIKKSNGLLGEYIKIEMKYDRMFFPEFNRNTMYKGMEINKKYTLKELGLDE